MQEIILAIITIVAFLTYLGLLVYCLLLSLHNPASPSWTKGGLNFDKNNIRLWGFAAGFIVFMLLFIADRLGYIEINALGFVRSPLFAILGFLVGFLLMEGARRADVTVFSALFIGLVVTGSLASFYAFIFVEDIRTELVFATMAFLLGVVLNFIIRKGFTDRETQSRPDHSWDD